MNILIGSTTFTSDGLSSVDTIQYNGNKKVKANIEYRRFMQNSTTYNCNSTLHIGETEETIQIEYCTAAPNSWTNKNEIRNAIIGPTLGNGALSITQTNIYGSYGKHCFSGRPITYYEVIDTIYKINNKSVVPNDKSDLGKIVVCISFGRLPDGTWLD